MRRVLLIVFIPIFLLLCFAFYPRLNSKYNLYLLKNDLSKADELCVMNSYSFAGKGDEAFITRGGRKIYLGKWDFGIGSDGLFLAILLKSGKLVKALPLIHPDAKSLSDNTLNGCRSLDSGLISSQPADG